jgi:hypothetical protein
VKISGIGTISEARAGDDRESEAQPQRLNEEHPAKDGGTVRSSRRLEESGRNAQTSENFERDF